MKGAKPIQVSWRQVAAFRLSRHHLVKRMPLSAVKSVIGGMAGAQAQLLQSAEMSVWSRVRGATLSCLDDFIWKDKTLAKAWCMRRTMFLVPSEELALFVRGSALRAEREIRWVLSKGVPQPKLEKLVAGVLDALDVPTTQSELAVKVSKSMKYKLQYKMGGVGWGNRHRVPWIDFGDLALPANYLLHLAGARGVYCSGPSIGTESTFVRADRWVPKWNDIAQRQAEDELLRRYLGAFGPSTISDFRIWTGMTMPDAREIWARAEKGTAQVDVEGRGASILASDLHELTEAALEGPVVRLLPFFDAFMLGHASHDSVVDPKWRAQVYRHQGWVSPVILVDGQAKGVWSYKKKSKCLKVVLKPFTSLSARTTSQLKEEAADLGRFFEIPDVEVEVSPSTPQEA